MPREFRPSGCAMFTPAFTHPLALASMSLSPAARAFQHAFEAAREPVRFAVCTSSCSVLASRMIPLMARYLLVHTIKIWDWELNGIYPSRDALHSVYTRAPGDLREAVGAICSLIPVPPNLTSCVRLYHSLGQCLLDARHR